MTPTAVIVRGPVPEFVTVVVCAALVVPIAWLPNVRLLGVRVTAGVGAAPLPLSARL
jgi:hypothetical protein